MNKEASEKIFIDQAAKKLNISRSTIYKHIKQLHIKIRKSGKKSYLTPDQVSTIKDKIDSYEPYQTVNTQETEEKINDLKNELKEEREKNERLLVQLGQWQGRAKTLEEQNLKLLEVKQEKSHKKGFIDHIVSFWKK